jgi:hypothetical protein
MHHVPITEGWPEAVIMKHEKIGQGFNRDQRTIEPRPLAVWSSALPTEPQGKSKGVNE